MSPSSSPSSYTYTPPPPPPHILPQSEDIQSLEEELSLASEQLRQVQELREECRKAEWRGRGKEKGKEGTSIVCKLHNC